MLELQCWESLVHGQWDYACKGEYFEIHCRVMGSGRG